MNTIGRNLWVMAAAILLTLAAGCSDRNPTELEVGRAKVDPVVFDDDYSEIVYYQPFFNTHYTAASIDTLFAYGGNAFDGARSLKFEIAPQNSALGLFTGGVLTSAEKRDLTDFNALTFYARSNANVSLNTAGFGNDNSGASLYEAGRAAIPLTGNWSFVVVPIPAPSRLRAERGLFTIAEGCEDGHPLGYNVWVDEIRFARLTNIEVVRLALNPVTQYSFVGTNVNITVASSIFRIDGALVPVSHSPNYFDYTSSDPGVALADQGTVRAVGTGTASITATMENFLDPANPHTVLGAITVNAFDPPTVAAATPTHPAGDVISLFSDAYDDVLVDTWRADWSSAVLAEYSIAGDNTKMYSSLFYVGILFETLPVNTTPMTHVHLDVYAPVGSNFEVKLAAAPPPGWSGNEPPQVNVVLDGTTTPAFTSGGWSSLDIPLADFAPVNWTDPSQFDWSSVNQMILATGDARLVLVDNVYFHK